MEPLSWGASVSDMLYTVANVHMEGTCVIVDVSYNDLRVGVVITDVFNVTFTVEHCSYVD